MLNKFKTMLLILTCAGLIAFTYYFYNPIRLDVDNNKLYLLDEVSENPYLFMYSENTARIDLSGLSNIVINMQKDGYEIQNYRNTDEYIDIILQNSSEVHRLYFTKDLEIISVSSPYSKSMVPYTYIIEKDVE